MSSLDTLLNPGEQVLYRSVPGWTLVRWRSVQFAASIGTFLPLLVLSGFLDWQKIPFLSLSMAIMALLIGSTLRDLTNILVTDRRILFCRGPFGLQSVEQMNAAEITQISMTWWKWPTTVCIRGHGAKRLRIPNIIDPGALVSEIARIAESPVPEQPRLNYGLAELWAATMANLSMIIFCLVCIQLFRWSMENLGDYKIIILYILNIILFLALILISIAIGFFVGRQLSTFFFPWLLSSDEARRFLGNEDDLSTKGKYWAALGRIHIRLMGMALSRAYGQPIRRDDAVST